MESGRKCPNRKQEHQWTLNPKPYRPLKGTVVVPFKGTLIMKAPILRVPLPRFVCDLGKTKDVVFEGAKHQASSLQGPKSGGPGAEKARITGTSKKESIRDWKIKYDCYGFHNMYKYKSPGI